MQYFFEFSKCDNNLYCSNKSFEFSIQKRETSDIFYFCQFP